MNSRRSEITAATAARIARLYQCIVGYDPLADGWTPHEALDVLREYKREGWASFRRERIQ